MLVDRMVVVVAPEEVVPHLVPLMQSGRTHCLYLNVVAVAPALSDLGEAPGVGISLVSWLALTPGLPLLPAALCSEATLEDTTLVLGTGH